jgi:hypothetical protein
MGKPSGPRAFRDPILISLISSTDGMLVSDQLLKVMQVSRVASLKQILEEVNKVTPYLVSY